MTVPALAVFKNSRLFISFQLPASSFRLPASSFRLPASSFQLPAVGYRPFDDLFGSFVSVG
jgi:hypothetical protein